MKKQHIIVLVTAPSKEEAEKIAHSLLNERLIACANIIGPVHSLFWWQGKIDKTQEHLILMKQEKTYSANSLKGLKPSTAIKFQK